VKEQENHTEFLPIWAGIINPGEVQQINSGNSSSLTANGFCSLFYSLKSSYIPIAKWLMLRSAI